jgi:hypothetical protein
MPGKRHGFSSGRSYVHPSWSGKLANSIACLTSSVIIFCSLFSMRLLLLVKKQDGIMCWSSWRCLALFRFSHMSTLF